MTDKEQINNFAKDINVPHKHKPIYLDGVDVSGCEDFREGYCYPDTGVCYKCDTNCQYAAFYLKEQLARKTQECEQIKEKYEALKHECEELKSESFTRESSLSMQEKDIDRYCKALEEIEEVINNILNSCLGRNTVSCRPAHNVCGDLINILDIINKAKEKDI